MPDRNTDPAELNGGSGTDNDTNPSLIQDDLEDRQSRRKFRSKIFKRTGWLVCSLFFIWMLTGAIAIFGASGYFYYNTSPTCHSYPNPEKTAKYLLIVFGIVTSVFLAMFMAIVSLAKEKVKKDDDDTTMEIVKLLGSQLTAFLKARTGH